MSAISRHVPGLVLLTLLLGALSILSVAPAQAACHERAVNVPTWNSGPTHTNAAVLLRDCGSYVVAEKAIATVTYSRACKAWTGHEQGIGLDFDLPYGSPLTEPYQHVSMFVPCKDSTTVGNVKDLAVHRSYQSHQNWTVRMHRYVTLRDDKATSEVGHFWPVT